jgi:hypothetical protein
MSGYNGFLDYQDNGSDFDAHSFVVKGILNRIATTTLVQVVKVSNAGELSPVGLVDVLPMVNQLDGEGNPTPHEVIHNLPYLRIQGGTNAIILDPQVGDKGAAIFCSRDISTVKRTKAAGNPGSARKYDWADGLYIFGFLNGLPGQYIGFSAAGIKVVSPTKITLTAPSIEIDASAGLTINANTATINANTAVTGTLTDNGHDVGSTHRHTGTQTGSGISGIPQ